MKTLWEDELTDLYGRPIRRPVIINGETVMEDGRPIWEALTVKMVCAESLVNHQEGDERHSYADKKRRSTLAKAILKAKQNEDVPVDPKALAELTDRINKGGWHSVITTDVTEMLTAVLQAK